MCVSSEQVSMNLVSMYVSPSQVYNMLELAKQCTHGVYLYTCIYMYHGWMVMAHAYVHCH